MLRLMPVLRSAGVSALLGKLFCFSAMLIGLDGIEPQRKVRAPTIRFCQ